MFKVISIILFGLILCPDHFSQQKIFGYKISGNGDIVSDVFMIRNGFVLDSVKTYNRTFRFEYEIEGKLKRDINFIYHTIYTNDGRIINIPDCRDYFYNVSGDIDSILYGMWNDSLQVYEFTTDGIKYSYSNEGRILSKTYSYYRKILKIEENSYDSSGNLILNKIIGRTYVSPTTYLEDTAYNIREYDSQNRLILTKSINKTSSSYQQFVFQYDSSGSINLTVQTIGSNLIRNDWNEYLSFDESGKVVSDKYSNYFNTSDSAWYNIYEIPFIYDEYDRIINIGNSSRFHYNSDGNLDSMANKQKGSNYLTNKATFIDSYGNKIILPDYSGYCIFYYSKLITGIKSKKLNNKTFTLSQNYPNPFNPTTTIDYSLPKSSFVILKIYDLLGREVVTLVNEEKHSGSYKITWNAEENPSGVYFYKITAGGYTKVNKMILLK